MEVLIVHAHHEAKSFSSALKDQAIRTLEAAGHNVVVSDLYAMGFDPVSDRRNFSSTKDADYLKQQAEESHASEVDGFAPEVENEIRKLEKADAVIFSYPLWWFGTPAILKGWIDRVLVAGRVYGGAKLYENGVGGSKKRGMVLMTTGGGPQAYDGWGLNPSLDIILAPIQHGTFWFNGIRPLEPFVAWSPARIGQESREEYLRTLAGRLENLFDEEPQKLPPMADFPNWGHDTKKRFLAVVSRKRQPDARYRELVPAELEELKRLKREGHLLQYDLAPPTATDWRAFLKFRADDEAAVESLLGDLPLAEYLTHTITEIAPVAVDEN